MHYKKIIIFSIIFLGILGLTNNSWAATPTISNVTGTIVTGQTITVTGTNMVNEDRTNWDPFFAAHPNASNFEGIDHLADGYRCLDCPWNMWADGIPIAYKGAPGRIWQPRYVTSPRLMGNQSIRFHVEFIDTNLVNVISNTTFTHSLSPAGIWFRMYAMWDSNDKNYSHLKFFDTMGGTQQTYIQPWPDLSGLIVLDHGGMNSCNPGTIWTQQCNYNVAFQKNRWYCIEIHYDTTPSIWVYKDGTLIIRAFQTIFENWTTFLMGIINTVIPYAGGYMDNWWDAFGVSTTRIYPASTIEISNNSTYGAGTLVYQEPIYLSDGSVQAKLDLSSLGSGPYYLWVTNNKQERSTVYTLGAVGPDTTPPAAPSGVTVL